MTYKIYPEQDVENIAEAIRNKNGLSNKYKIGEMAEAINNLGIYSLSGEDNAPYLYRKTPLTSDAELDKIVGGSVVFNQLMNPYYFNIRTIDNGITVLCNQQTGEISVSGTATDVAQVSFTGSSYSFVNGHVYYLAQPNGASASTYYIKTGTAIFWAYRYIGKQNDATTDVAHFRVYVAKDQTVDFTFKPMYIDLTQMFGTTIADYVYQLEQATAGAGVAYLKSLGFFTDDYYPYNAGEIKSVSGLSSHDMVGFNQWDEEWENGSIKSSDGANTTDANRIRVKNFIPIVETTYYVKAPSNLTAFYYDTNKGYLGYKSIGSNATFTHISGARYMRFTIGTSSSPVTTYNNDICINISDTNRNGEYEPYIKHSYPLDNTLTLRGIPKITDGKLYYDGDTYNSDGSVVRKYGVVDLGTCDWLLTGGTDGYFYTTISTLKNNTDWTVVPNIVCKIYQTTYPDAIANKQIDKAVSTWKSGNRLIVRDTSYTSTADFKSAMQGVYLIYELAEPTTESAEPYSTIQLYDGAGTEEYVTTGIPVGHETKYLELVEN